MIPVSGPRSAARCTTEPALPAVQPAVPRADANDPYVPEHGLGHSLRRPLLLAARLEQRDVGGGDHRDVIAQGDVARHALLLTRRNSQRDVAARQREVGRSRACGHEAEILGQHVGGDDRALLDAHLGDQVEDVIDVGVAVDGQELATASSRRQVAGGLQIGRAGCRGGGAVNSNA